MKKKSTSQSAFFKLRLLFGVLLCFAGITIVLLAQPGTPSAQSGNSTPRFVQAQFRGVLPVVKFDISPPLRDMKPLPATGCTLRENEDRDIMTHGPAPCSGSAGPGCATSAWQDWNTSPRSSVSMETATCVVAPPRPQWSGRSQSRGDEGLLAFPNIQ